MGIVIIVMLGLAFVSYLAYCNCADKAENENYQKAKKAWLEKNPGKQFWGWGWYQPLQQQQQPLQVHRPSFAEGVDNFFEWLCPPIPPPLPPPTPMSKKLEEDAWKDWQ